MILAERAARLQAIADLSSTEALISHLKLEIEKLRRTLYGTRSERKARLLEQMELQLEELEATATEDELAAEQAAARTQTVQSFQRKRPSRKPFPDHLPRERVVISPIALAAVKRIDALFDIERGINGQSAEERLRVRKEQSAALLTAMEAWLREQRARLSNSSSVAKPIDYMLRRWDRFAGFIDDGRICLTNNAAERALRGFALGRKSWLFAGSDRGADRAAIMATLIMTAKLNDVDPQAWLADVLARINDHKIHDLAALLPWNWRKPMPSRAEAA